MQEETTPELDADKLAQVSRRISSLEAARYRLRWTVTVTAAVVGALLAALFLAAPRAFAALKGSP